MANEENTEIKLQNWFLGALCQKQTDEKLIKPQCWRKSCFNSCSEMKLERAKKRKIETVEDESVESNLEENVSSVSQLKGKG